MVMNGLIRKGAPRGVDLHVNVSCDQNTREPKWQVRLSIRVSTLFLYITKSPRSPSPANVTVRTQT